MIRRLGYFFRARTGASCCCPAPLRRYHLLVRIAIWIINPARRFKANPSPVVGVEPDTAIGVAKAHGPMEGDMWVAVTALVLAAAIGFDVIAVALRRSDHSDLTDKV
jgi:hypothetical protein